MIAAYSLPRLKAMGLKLYGFLGNVGGQGSIAAAMKRRTDFFAEAIAFAKQNQYDGYSSVSCHDIAAIWVAVFPRSQRYRC